MYFEGTHPNLATLKFLEINDNNVNDQLIHYDKQEMWTRYKFGLLYVKEGQSDENQMFANGMIFLRIFLFFSEFLNNFLELKISN